MTDHEHDGMKRCTKCGEWKPATAEFFNRDNTRTGGLHSMCKECRREYRQKNRDRKREYQQKNKDYYREYQREYYQKNKDRIREYTREYQREYYQKNKDRIREYGASNVGRLCDAVKRIRRKTGATIYLRDMTEEQKETLANQCVAIRTLEKTEKELLATSGKKRCTRCDRILDYGCFHKNMTNNDGVDFWCRECCAERGREYYQQNKDKIREYYEKNKDYYREYHEKNKDKTKELRREYYEKNKD